MKNQKCPTCFMLVRSDAMLEKYCKLCGMGIEETNKSFCCKRCLRKYRIVLSERRKVGEVDEKNN